MIITAVCLNPCIDKTVTIPQLVVGGMNRIQSSRIDYVGKGVNVAMNMRALGIDVACVGCIGHSGGDETIARLKDAGAEAEFIRVDGAERVNMKVIDSSAGRITEINEAGPDVGPGVYERVETMAATYARRSGWVVLTGSLPRGLGKETYARLIRAVRREAPDCRVALDAEGEAFALAVDERPDLIKPNQYELELYSGATCDTAERAASVGEALVRRGIPYVIISMGADGAIWLEGQERLFSPALDVAVRSTAGAGDAMLSGWLYAYLNGMDSRKAFRMAVAAAGAKVATEGTQAFAMAEMMRLYERTTVSEI